MNRGATVSTATTFRCPTLNEFEHALRALHEGLTDDDLPTDTLLIAKDDSLAVYYAPLDYVNREAKVAIVGITPGLRQMTIACRTARDMLHAGVSCAEMLRAVKRAASFAGSMRTNLVSMLDRMDVNRALGIDSTASLFDAESHLVHTTSAVRHPAFVNGRNYTGHSPKLLETPILANYVYNVLANELEAASKALVVPLGKSVDLALQALVSSNRVDGARCLLGFPHPSGANGHRASTFNGRRDELRSQVAAWFS